MICGRGLKNGWPSVEKENGNHATEMNDVTPPEQRSSPALRLWLEGYHTPSLNVTTGCHWKTYYGLKQKAAAALLDALPGQGLAANFRPALILDSIKKGGRAGAMGKAIKAKAVQQMKSAKAAWKGGRVVLQYVRVTTQPLDAENFCGSTKAITDCLRMAFPELLPDDAPEWVQVVHLQQRCSTEVEEGTWVTIWKPMEQAVSEGMQARVP